MSTVATSIPERDRLEAEITSRRSEAQRRTSRRLAWQDALTSLWAPVTVLGVALIPYLLVTQLVPSVGTALVAPMQTFGLLLFAWFVGLLVWRAVGRRGAEQRKLRHAAREVTSEVAAALRSPAAVPDAQLRGRLVEQAARVDAASLEAGPGVLRREVDALAELAGKVIPRFRKQNAMALGMGLGKALVVALLIRTVIIEPFKIPSGSMIPTLEIGDQIFVNKFIYGVRIPFVNKVPFVIVRKPARGDVIVFNNPVDTSNDFIKRVVGLPGDVVEVRDGVVFVNGAAEPRRLVAADDHLWDWQTLTRSWEPFDAQRYEENLDGVRHAILQQPHKLGRGRQGPYLVPAGAVFVMGDNRDNSADSRLGFGRSDHVEFVPYGNIKGKAMMIWLSIGHGGLFSSWFDGTGLNLSRFFLPVR